MNGILNDMTLAERVQVEAMATGYRRETARQTGATVRGVRGPAAQAWTIGDRVRELAEQMEAEEAAARRLDMSRRIGAPNELIATMKADWPEQAQAVKAWAEAEGLKLGEAWARLISAAVDRIQGGADE